MNGFGLLTLNTSGETIINKYYLSFTMMIIYGSNLVSRNVLHHVLYIYTPYKPLLPWVQKLSKLYPFLFALGSPPMTSVKSLAGLRNKSIRVKLKGVYNLETAFVNLYKDKIVKMAGTINE